MVESPTHYSQQSVKPKTPFLGDELIVRKANSFVVSLVSRRLDIFHGLSSWKIFLPNQMYTLVNLGRTWSTQNQLKTSPCQGNSMWSVIRTAGAVAKWMGSVTGQWRRDCNRFITCLTPATRNTASASHVHKGRTVTGLTQKDKNLSIKKTCVIFIYKVPNSKPAILAILWHLPSHIISLMRARILTTPQRLFPENTAVPVMMLLVSY